MIILLCLSRSRDAETNMKLTLFVPTIVLVIGYRSVACIPNNVAELLRFDLLKNYDSFTEPSPQNGSALKIGAAPYIMGIDVDYMKSSFHLIGWIRMRWSDPRLTWDPSLYDDIKMMHFAPNEIWKPQMIALNRLDAHVIENYSQNYMLVSHLGVVLFVPVTNFMVSCTLNYYAWPFDKQVCELILRITGTRTTPMQFNSTSLPNSSSESIISNWEIETVNTQFVSTNSCLICSGPISELHFEFRVRKTEVKYYGFVILPAFGLCFLLLSTFWLPLTSTKKLTLGIILVIVPVIFLLFFSRKVPVFNHQMPKIMLFYSWLMLLSIINFLTSLILSSIVNSKTLHDNPVAQNIKTLFDRPILHFLRLVPDSEFVRYQLRRMDPSQKSNENHAKLHWLNITIVVNRMIFLLYSIIMILVILCC